MQHSQKPKAFLTPALLKYSAAYAAYVVFLHSVNGPWRDWKEGREGSPIDPWTGQHLLWGAIGSAMGLRPKQILILGTVNELVEFGVRKTRPDLLWGSPESPSNVFMDLVGNLVGWKIGELLMGETK